MKERIASEIARRELLQVGGLGLFGLTIPGVNRLRAAGPEKGRTPKRVVYIFLTGGSSQHETFDMKPDASRDIRGEFRPIATTAPGLQICELLPRLAKWGHKLAVVRSMSHFSNKHIEGSYIMVTGDTLLPQRVNKKHPDAHDAPGITAVAGRYRPGENHVPSAVVLPHFLLRNTGRFIPGQYGGWMGPQYDPWVVHAAAYCKGLGPCPECFGYHKIDELLKYEHDVEPFFAPPRLGLPEAVTPTRFRDRLSLLDDLDDRRQSLDDLGEKGDQFQKQAVQLLSSSKASEAFDLSKVDDKVLDAYGRNMFGLSLLLTRQLLEAGVNMLQVNLGRNGTWDLHSSIFPVLKDHLLPQTDQALATFLQDLDERGLLDETLVVAAGEFGRTPRVFSIASDYKPGRGHWGPVQSVLFVGGGVNGGTIVGASDSIGGEVKSNKKTPQDLAATIYDALGIPRDTHYYDINGRPIAAYQGRPITELYG